MIDASDRFQVRPVVVRLVVVPVVDDPAVGDWPDFAFVNRSMQVLSLPLAFGSWPNSLAPLVVTVWFEFVNSPVVLN